MIGVGAKANTKQEYEYKQQQVLQEKHDDHLRAGSQEESNVLKAQELGQGWSLVDLGTMVI